MEVTDTEYKRIVDDLLKPVLIPEKSISQLVSNWLIEGMVIHDIQHNVKKNNETCEFCGNQFNPENVKEQILLKTSSIHAKFIKKLSYYEELVSKSIQNEKKKPDIFFEKERIEFRNSASYLLSLIKKKLENTELELQVEPNNWDNLVKLDNSITNEIAIVSEQLNNYDKQLKNIESVAKSWIGKQLLDDDESNINIPIIIRDIQKKIEDNSKIISQNVDWISKQKNTNSDLDPFAQVVNDQFKIIDLDLSLEVNADHNTYKIVHCNSSIRLLARDLSEGERKLLAFLHFYYDLSDKIKSNNDGIKQVIIDDPITSLDADNRYYLTEIINIFIKETLQTYVQVFVFTHSSMDFHNFGFSSRSNNDLKFWHIHKNELGDSEIELKNKQDLKNYSDYYHSIFSNVMKFALKPNGTIDQVTIHMHFGNQARLVLETHARSNYRIENVTSSSVNTLFEVYEIPLEKQTQFTNMLNVINSLSHGISMYDTPINTISPAEIRNSIRTMIGVLYKKDSRHIEKMSGNILNRNQRDNIQNWF